MSSFVTPESLIQTLNLHNRSTDPLVNYRVKAKEFILSSGFPTTSVEEWRFTNIQPLIHRPFQYGTTDADVSILQIEREILSKDFHLIVLVNGKYDEEYSNLNIGAGDEFAVKEIIPDHPADEQLIKHFSKSLSWDYDAFSALNTALFDGGIFIHIPRDAVLRKPIHLMNIACSGSQAVNPNFRVHIIGGKNSQFSVIESYSGAGGESYFNNVVTEIHLETGSHMKYYKLQNEDNTASHISRTGIQVSEYAGINVFNFIASGKLVRNDIVIDLVGKNAQCKLIGFLTAKDRAHYDNHTYIHHRVPLCSSEEIYKGILKDRSHSVFNGLITVHPGAVNTSAVQNNHTLLMSDSAVSNSNPQLEIYTDEVTCTHGSTTGELDNDALFYLMSRGINEIDARKMLIQGFAGEILEWVEVEQVRSYVLRRIDQFLNEDLESKHG